MAPSGLSEKDAVTLTSDRSLSDFFESTLTPEANIKGLVNWTVNAVQGWAKAQ